MAAEDIRSAPSSPTCATIGADVHEAIAIKEVGQTDRRNGRGRGRTRVGQRRRMKDNDDEDDTEGERRKRL